MAKYVERVTIALMGKWLGIPPHIISAVLDKGYKLGLLRRERIRRYFENTVNTSTYQWFYVDIEGST